MRTTHRSIATLVIAAAVLVVAACVPPPSPPRPRLSLPGDIVVQATSDDGAVVAYEASATDPEEGPVPIDCAPESGSLFPVGATTVSCTATNSEGRSRSGKFTVTVTDGSGTTSTTSTTASTTSTTASTTSTTASTTTTTTSTTTTLPGPTTTTQPGSGPPPIAAGDNHTCAIRTDGTVACWGYNLQGQLGIGSTTARFNTPQNVPGLTNITAIDAGRQHTCALRADGQVFCWGAVVWGQLGEGSNGGSPIRVPTAVTNMSNAIAISTGTQHSCAVRSNNTVACWGDGDSGRLGTAFSGSAVPRTVNGISDAVSISSGGAHNCVLRTGGTSSCWGSNNNGQLGNGSTTTSLAPIQVALPTVSSISTGAGFTCATSAGAPYCWGENVRGNLGSATFNGEGDIENSVSSPLLVPNLIATRIETGSEHACAVLATDGVRCWGGNGEGQLGNGNRLNSMIINASGVPTGYRTPVDVPGLTGVATVAAGENHTCARRTNGSIACWGGNVDGQLGNGNFSRQLAPVAVAGF